MARNRVIYQSEAVFVGTTGTAAPTQMRRVQSCNYNFSIERQDINQFGELASIERLILREPTVTVDMSYYFEPSATNEGSLGLFSIAGGTAALASGTGLVSQHILTNIASGLTSANEKNIFILTSDPGVDANEGTGVNGAAAYDGVIGIGNAFLTSWSLETAVGAIPIVSCAFEGQNIKFDTYTGAGTFPNPSINSAGSLGGAVTVGAASMFANTEVSAVRPGDVTLTLTADDDNAPLLGFLETDLKVQTANVAFTLTREPIRKLGKAFAFARELTFPIMCTMSVTAIVGEAFATTISTLSTLMATNGDVSKFNCTLKLTGYNAAGTASYAYLALKGAKLNSQNVTSSIGPNKSVTFELSSQIGKNSGLHLYGAATS